MNRPAGVDVEATKPEYQHFIAQFILRKFSHEYKGKTEKAEKLYNKNKVVNVLDLSKDEPRFTLRAVKRMFGNFDMYSDISALTPAQKRRAKTELGKLESETSLILQKILTACDDGRDIASLSHHEEFLLKKFIFVMKYRSTLFFDQYNHTSIHDYTADNKRKLLPYMRRCGLQRPIDVWLDNLMRILTGPFTSTDDYVRKLYVTIFPADAVWVDMRMRLKYPVLCVPQNGSEEFVLSEHAFSLSEGPDDGDGKAWTEFHTVCIVSPKLAILMRDDYIPEIVDDRDDNIRAKHAQKLCGQLSAHYTPSKALSMFHNLPVYKPRVSYTKAETGYISPKSGKSLNNPADLLDFPITRIISNVTQDINALVLNESHVVSEIVCKSKAALSCSIDSFLRMPSEGVYCLKNYPSETDARVDHIKKLERFLLAQGLHTKAVYTLPQTRTTFHIPQHIDEPYDQVVHEAGAGLHSYPVPRAQHTADMETPFRPENEGMFESAL